MITTLTDFTDLTPRELRAWYGDAHRLYGHTPDEFARSYASDLVAAHLIEPGSARRVANMVARIVRSDR